MQTPTIALAILAAGPLAAPHAPLAPPVIIRHDREDAAYRALAAEYPSACDVGADGQGTLITPRWVLTAAHVAAGMNGFTARVGFGGQVHGRGGEDYREYRVDHVVLHPSFQETRRGPRNDIALLRLAEPVSGIEPTPLYEGEDEVGRQVVLVGCGDTGNGEVGANAADGVWRAATNTVLKADGSRLEFRFDAPGSDEATDLEGFWGPGDSGGPCFIEKDGKRYIAGVSSHGYDVEDDGIRRNYGEMDVSMRVSHYREWIRATLEAEAKAEPTLREPVLTEGPCPLPEHYVGGVAAAYLPALGGDADARKEFVELFVLEPEARDRDPLSHRIWHARMMPAGMGPFVPRGYSTDASGRFTVLAKCPQVDDGLLFTFVMAGEQNQQLQRVRLGLMRMPE